MTHNEATAFLKDVGIDDSAPRKWADLGCGSGAFTFALAEYLHQKSTIHALDVQHQQITPKNAVAVQFLQLDFEKETIPFKNLDGILMANSLHFVKNKPAFIPKLEKNLAENGLLIVIEYNSASPNPWVPYPIQYEELKALVSRHGFSKIARMGERKSIYGNHNMYLCKIEK